MPFRFVPFRFLSNSTTLRMNFCANRLLTRKFKFYSEFYKIAYVPTILINFKEYEKKSRWENKQINEFRFLILNILNWIQLEYAAFWFTQCGQECAIVKIHRNHIQNAIVHIESLHSSSRACVPCVQNFCVL